MKASFILIIVIVIYCIGMVTMKQNRDIKNNQEIIISKVDSLRDDYKRRTTKDSLYMEHLKVCSFINKDNVKVGHNNYLYLATNKK